MSSDRFVRLILLALELASQWYTEYANQALRRQTAVLVKTQAALNRANAAINLKNLAGSSPVSARCPRSAGSIRRAKLPVGREPMRKEQAHV
jgi:hypothetical protein